MPHRAFALIAVLFTLALPGSRVDAQEPDVSPRLRAEIHGPSAIRFTLTGAPRPTGTDAVRLTDGQGRAIEVARVIPNTASEALLVPAEPLDALRVHYLQVPELELRALVRRDPLFRNL